MAEVAKRAAERDAEIAKIRGEFAEIHHLQRQIWKDHFEEDYGHNSDLRNEIEVKTAVIKEEPATCQLF